MRRRPTHPKLATLQALAMASVLALAVIGPATAHDRGDHSRGHDDDPAGTIASFDASSGKLVINLTEGDSIAGLVTRRTWIESGDDCERDRQALNDWCRKRHHLSNGGGDHGWHHGHDGDTDDLVEGAVVDDAVLVLSDGRATFVKIKLDD